MDLDLGLKANMTFLVAMHDKLEKSHHSKIKTTSFVMDLIS